jgi:hypothetical protein
VQRLRARPPVTRSAVPPSAATPSTMSRPGRDALPDPDETAEIATAVESPYRALVLLAGFGGLRWGKLARLRRAGVDLCTASSTWRSSSPRSTATSRSGRRRAPPAAARSRCPRSWLRSSRSTSHTTASPDPDGHAFPAAEGGPDAPVELPPAGMAPGAPSVRPRGDSVPRPQARRRDDGRLDGRPGR